MGQWIADHQYTVVDLNGQKHVEGTVTWLMPSQDFLDAIFVAAINRLQFPTPAGPMYVISFNINHPDTGPATVTVNYRDWR